MTERTVIVHAWYGDPKILGPLGLEPGLRRVTAEELLDLSTRADVAIRNNSKREAMGKPPVLFVSPLGQGFSVR